MSSSIDLTTENITQNVQIINSTCQDARTRFVFEQLVQHLHDFARSVRLSTDEWMVAIETLTMIGQISTDLRHEMILLSDVLGLSALIDSIDHPKTSGSTEGTVLGPFHTHDALETENGYKLHTDPDATSLFVLCSIKDTKGNPIVGAKVDVWEGDSKGFYDVQNPDRTGPDGRAVLLSDHDGLFYFQAIVPVPYPIPADGPVGSLLRVLGRHPNRPGHVHFMIAKAGYDKLTTYDNSQSHVKVLD
jgi:protocatechuate 3,4-dioxygenase beta subunit